MLLPPSSSALVLAAHVPLSLCQRSEDRLGFCLLLLYQWLGEGSRVSLLLGKTSRFRIISLLSCLEYSRVLQDSPHSSPQGPLQEESTPVPFLSHETPAVPVVV